MFPTAQHTNLGIVLTGPASHFDFTPFITELLPNLHILDTAQFFPRWTHTKPESEDSELDFASTDTTDIDEYGYRRIDNITDEILKLYRDAIGGRVTKDDIFCYVYGLVYGLLHDPAYRQAYAADLKKMLPHIPTPETREKFERLAEAGRKLAELHMKYESVDPYPLDVQIKPGADPADRETWRADHRANGAGAGGQRATAEHRRCTEHHPQAVLHREYVGGRDRQGQPEPGAQAVAHGNCAGHDIT